MSTTRTGAIVVGVDDTALAGRAVGWATEQAVLERRPLLLVHASGAVTSAWGDRATDVPAGTFSRLHAEGNEVLARARAVVSHISSDVEVEEVFDVVDPTTLILDAAADAHLVVLGSHGRGPTLTRLLGSVALRVVRHATCPVVVHRHGHPGRVRDGVLAAVEAEREASVVLEAAYRMASLRRLPLHVVHYVYDARSVLVGTPMVGDIGEQERAESLVVAEAIAGLRERYPDVHTRVETLRGLPEHRLVDAAARTDLLVVGTHQRGIVGRLLAGSVSEAVLEHAACPIMVVPTPVIR